jgi:hypothetical protein
MDRRTEMVRSRCSKPWEGVKLRCLEEIFDSCPDRLRLESRAWCSLYIVNRCLFVSKLCCHYTFLTERTYLHWSESLATDPQVRVRFPALPDFLRSGGSGTGSSQPREYN